MKRNFLVLAAAIICSYAQSQDTASAKALDEVIVTANKLPQKQSQTGKVITVIGQDVLKRSTGKTFTEILNYQAGIFINGANNPLGTNQDFYFRGATTGNVLILIDGVPVSDPSQISNTYDLNNINPTQIERIEILKGAQSTLWGSDAVAGVVNIITKKGGTKAFQLNALLSYGSYNTFRGSVGIKGQTGGFNYNLNYTRTDSKGFSAAYDSTKNKGYDKDGFKQNGLQANLGYRFSNKLSVLYTGNWSKYKADIDAGAFVDDKDSRIENENLLNTLRLQFTSGKLSLQAVQSLIHSERANIDDSTNIGGFSSAPFAFYTKWARGNYKGLTSVSEVYGNYTFSNLLSAVAGVQYLRQNTTQDYKSISNYGPFASTPLGKDSTNAHNLSVYASLLLANLNGFNTEAGIRFNDNSIYGNNTTFLFNPSYNVDENTRVFVNISSGYRIPSLYQLYSEYGNKSLKPEESKNYEFGVQTYTNNRRNFFRVVAFKRDIKQLIVFYTNPTTFTSRYINRDKQNDYGFEMESITGIGTAGSWSNNLTYVDGEGTNNNVKIRNLFRRPNFTFNSVLTVVAAKRLTLAPAFRFVGARAKGQYDAGPTVQGQYYNLDLYTAYDFMKNSRVFVDLRNLTDQAYFDIVGYNSRRFNMMAGVQISF